MKNLFSWLIKRQPEVAPAPAPVKEQTAEAAPAPAQPEVDAWRLWLCNSAEVWFPTDVVLREGEPGLRGLLEAPEQRYFDVVLEDGAVQRLWYGSPAEATWIRCEDDLSREAWAQGNAMPSAGATLAVRLPYPSAT